MPNIQPFTVQPCNPSLQFNLCHRFLRQKHDRLSHTSCHVHRSTVCKDSHNAVFQSVTVDRGFLPEHDPLTRLPEGFSAYEDALRDLPNLALSRNLRKTLRDLPPVDLRDLVPAQPAAAEAWQHHLQLPLQPANNTYAAPHELCVQQHRISHSQDVAEHQSSTWAAEQQDGAVRASDSLLQCDVVLWRAYQVVSFLSHAYMWCGGADIPKTLPSVLAQPWTVVASALKMPPVLVYATYNLMNWRRLDAELPVELGNLAVQQQFLGGVDESWFRLVHVAIEAAAAPALAVLQPLQVAARQRDVLVMEQHLCTIASGLQSMQALLDRMSEHCDPYIYYHRVRIPMSGWRNNPALPSGLIYEGLWGDEPQQLYGETGAQSGIVAAFDAVLGIQHQEGWLRRYLTDMRAHMPPGHRRYLKALETGPSVRDTISSLCSTSIDSSSPAGNRHYNSLLEAYNDAVHQLEKFRAQHRGFAQQYIAQWSRQDATGTGGSDFMPALTGYKTTTGSFKLKT